MSCMCIWRCDGMGNAYCSGCGGDLCICVCGGEFRNCECDVCTAFVWGAVDGDGLDDHDENVAVPADVPQVRS